MSKPLKVYTVVASGHWLNSYSVVVARDRGHARRLLAAELKKHGIDVDKLVPPENLDTEDFGELDTSKPMAVVLFNGDY